jgi:pimeloyl-ACP methyl ester carboxylesterase
MSRESHTTRRVGVTASGCALVLGLFLGCTSEPEPDPAPFQPTLEWGACPDDVETTFLTPHECGILTVLVDRAEPTGATLSLLVGKVPPPAGAAAPGLGTSFGPNFGDSEVMSGAMAAGAARMGRTSLQLEWRGSGPHNSTSLACPEVDELRVGAAGVLHDDPGIREAFTGAISACAARLRSQGVDPGDYTAEAMAQDVEDLRVAAGVDTWEMAGSYGTQSAVLLTYLDRHPGRVKAAYLDSPSFTSPAGFHGGAAALQDALDELVRSCEQAATCAADHPDLAALWTRALDRTTTTPLVGRVAVDGQDVTVLVDAPKLVRMARFALGGEGAPLAALPRIIHEAALGNLAPELARAVVGDPVFCSGYRPLCHDSRFSLGLYLTHLCGAAPLTGADRSEATRGTGPGHPAYAAVYEDSPYTQACEVWGVDPAPTKPSEPSGATAGIPMLMMSGSLDSFSPPADTRDAASAMGPGVHVLEVPGGTHNVLGFSECAITARNAWSHDLAAPSGQACAGAPQVQFR